MDDFTEVIGTVTTPQQVWYRKNKVRALAKIKEWQAAHKENIREASKRWRNRNRERVNKYMRDRYRIKHNLPLDAPLYISTYKPN